MKKKMVTLASHVDLGTWAPVRREPINTYFD